MMAGIQTIALLSCLGASVGIAAPVPDTSPAQPPLPSPLETAEDAQGMDNQARFFPMIGSDSRSLLIPAVAKPHREALLSTSTDAMLRHIVVEAGERVEEGDPIAYLDDTVLRAAANSAKAAAEREAGVERAKQALELARITYKRTLDAHRNNAAHDTELDQARISFMLAEAELAAAIENKHIAELDLEMALARVEERVIRAPFDGRVVRVDGEEGTILQTGDPIATVADFAKLRIHLDVPSAWYDKLHVGSVYRLAAEDEMWGEPVAELVFVEPQINPATSTVRCEFTIDNSAIARPAGFTVVPVTSDGPMMTTTASRLKRFDEDRFERDGYEGNLDTNDRYATFEIGDDG